MKTPAELLTEARELFASTHWTQGHWYTVDEKDKAQYCLIGGLREIAGFDPAEGMEEMEEGSYAEAVTALFMIASPDDDPDDYDVSSREDVLVSFNDDAQTQLDDVLRLLDQAKEKLAVPA